MKKIINGEPVRVNNEKDLWIEADAHFLYVTTDRDTITEAVEEFRERLESIGCNSDNFFLNTKMELREWDDRGNYEVLESTNKIDEEIGIDEQCKIYTFETYAHAAVRARDEEEAFEKVQALPDSEWAISLYSDPALVAVENMPGKDRNDNQKARKSDPKSSKKAKTR